jgi:hypothetical protein
MAGRKKDQQIKIYKKSLIHFWRSIQIIKLLIFREIFFFFQFSKFAAQLFYEYLVKTLVLQSKKASGPITVSKDMYIAL